MAKAAASLSHALLVNMGPIMEEQAVNIISAMKADYRMGKLDHTKTISHIAQLVILEDLVDSLKAKINKGKNLEDRRT